MKLRLGVVGLGTAWETRHRSALRALSDRIEVRAFCDQVAHRAEQAAREFGGVAVDGYRSLIERDDIDAVLLLGRQWYGPAPLLAACDAGKAVYCGTEFELNSEMSSEIKSRIETAGIAFMAEFPCRLAPATLRLKELLATRLGAPRLIFCHRRSPAQELAGTNRGPALERSQFADLIELVDWCCYVAGSPPTSVMGLLHEAAVGGHDYQMMNLDFNPTGRPGCGVTAQLSCGRYVPAHWQEAVTFRPPAALQVSCEQGIAFIDLPSSLIWFDEAGRHLESLDSERPVGERLLTQFLRAVTSLVRNTQSLEETWRAMSIVRLAQASHIEGRRLPVV